MEPRDVPESRRAEAVSAFDAKYGDQCQVVLCLSRHSRPALLAGESSPVLEKLISTIRTWWPVRAPADTDPYMAAAITKAIGWSPDVFRPTSAFGSETADFAVELVDKVVASAKELSGSWRREYSWTSKTVHWLLPWRVPAFDKNVRNYLGVPKGWDNERAVRRGDPKDLRAGAAGASRICVGWAARTVHTAPRARQVAVVGWRRQG
jgi:hypothetical protein